LPGSLLEEGETPRKRGAEGPTFAYWVGARAERIEVTAQTEVVEAAASAKSLQIKSTTLQK
jgi:hypothetical protein